MITRPSTPRIIDDICEELRSDIMPALTDPAQQIRLHMLMVTLINCANASECENSFMRSEITEYLSFALDVAEATGNADVSAVVAAAKTGESLVLSDVIDDYQRASRAFSTAMDVVMDTVNRDFIERGEAILRTRLANEREIFRGSASVGRSAS